MRRFLIEIPIHDEKKIVSLSLSLIKNGDIIINNHKKEDRELKDILCDMEFNILITHLFEMSL